MNYIKSKVLYKPTENYNPVSSVVYSLPPPVNIYFKFCLSLSIKLRYNHNHCLRFNQSKLVSMNSPSMVISFVNLDTTILENL